METQVAFHFNQMIKVLNNCHIPCISSEIAMVEVNGVFTVSMVNYRYAYETCFVTAYLHLV